MTDPEVRAKPVVVAASIAVLVLMLAAATAFLLLRSWGLAPGGESGAKALVDTIPPPRLQTAPQQSRPLSPTPAPETRQRLGASLPAVLHLRDADGNPVDRASLLRGGRPILLLPAWYRCDTLCGTTAHGALEALADTGLPADAWRMVVFSIDPLDRPEDARLLQAVYRRYAAFARPAVFAAATPDLRLLVGDAAATRALADGIGFGWAAEPAGDGAPGFAHAAGVVVLTPGGVVSKYLLGVRFDPKALRSALVEASDGRIGSLSERLLLACSHFDPVPGGRDGAVIVATRVLGLGVLGALLAWMWRQHARGQGAGR